MIKVNQVAGTCSTYTISFMGLCVPTTRCNKYYVGRTVCPLRERVNEHRGKFYELLSAPAVHLSRTSTRLVCTMYSVGAHFFDYHDILDKKAVNSSYKVLILTNSSSTNLI